MSSRNIRIDYARCRTSQKYLIDDISLGYSGDANKNFLMFLFSDKTAGIQLLKSREVQGTTNVSVPQIIQFTQLLANAASTDWSSCTTPASSGSCHT